MAENHHEAMKTVITEKIDFKEYIPIIGEEKANELLNLAKKFKDKKVLHINSTAYGGGVAEILHSLVPLMNSIGVNTTWKVIQGGFKFFEVTKKFHNALQGMDIALTPEMKKIYIDYNWRNMEGFVNDYDYIFIHDPQPAYLINYIPRNNTRFIFRIHIDLTNANPEYWNFLKDSVSKFDAAIFTMREYVKKDLNVPIIRLIPPSIDPISAKNKPLPKHEAQKIVERFGVDVNRPILLQVSRYDPWKDPLGVIDAYRIVKKEIPGVQLLLQGSMASDDPEGWDYLKKTARRAGEDFDIRLLHKPSDCGKIEVNATQVAADVVIQKSIREGFGLVVTEAMWKGQPVIGGNAGGIVMQVKDGKTGFLVNSPQECAERALQLLRDKNLKEKMGKAAKEHVQKNFLITRTVKDHLELMEDLDR